MFQGALLSNALRVCTMCTRLPALSTGPHHANSCTYCTHRPLKFEPVLYNTLVAGQERPSGETCSGHDAL